jgi:hypothetical protein
MKGNTILTIEGICKVESDSHEVKITVIKYSLGKQGYFSKSIKIDKVNIPILIRLLEVANDSGQI